MASHGWDPQTGQELRQFRGTGSIWDAMFSPDDRYLLTANGEARTVFVWEVQTGQLVRTFSNIQAISSGAAWSPDGKRIAAAGDNNSVVLWDFDLDALVQSVCKRLTTDLTDDERKSYGVIGNTPICSQFAAQSIATAAPTVSNSAATVAPWTPIPTATIPVWTPLPALPTSATKPAATSAAG